MSDTAVNRKVENSITHSQFLNLCSCLQEIKQQVTTDRPPYSKVHGLLETMCGFKFSSGIFRMARETTGIDWKPASFSKSRGTEAARGRRYRVLRFVTCSTFPPRCTWI